MRKWGSRLNKCRIDWAKPHRALSVKRSCSNQLSQISPPQADLQTCDFWRCGWRHYHDNNWPTWPSNPPPITAQSFLSSALYPRLAMVETLAFFGPLSTRHPSYSFRQTLVVCVPYPHLTVLCSRTGLTAQAPLCPALSSAFTLLHKSSPSSSLIEFCLWRLW